MSLLLKALQQADRGSNLSLEPLQEHVITTPPESPASTPPASAKAAAALMLQKQANAEKRRLMFLLSALVLVVVGMAIYFYLAIFAPWVFIPKSPPAAAPVPIVVAVDPSQNNSTAPPTTVFVPTVPLPRTEPVIEQPPVLHSLETVKPIQQSRNSSVSAANDPGIRIGAASVDSNAALSAGGINNAYQLLQEGRLEDARRAYEKLRFSEPSNVDILLGLGLIAQRQGRTEEAMQLYLKTLGTDPQNMFAHASLTSIIAHADPAAAESKLKALIAQQPGAFLYFSLGNVYAAQGRWNEAQKAYFEAQRLAPDSPDYAFNLAVSLERIRQPRVALDYYQRALKLSQTKTATFDLAQLKSRIQQLSITP